MNRDEHISVSKTAGEWITVLVFLFLFDVYIWEAALTN